jgi:phospholipid/cholesterol/gamma-HCH transport system substrate-binding protein
METKASHFVIGFFVLAMVSASFFFVVWLAKVEVDRELDFYNVFFEDGVAGLSVGGDVRYNGIPVGTVTSIILDPKDASRVQVAIEVDKGTPVSQGTEASLALQGITGVAYIELTGGGPDAPPLLADASGARPAIPSRRSTIQRLAADAPELLAQAISLIDDLRKLVDENNRASFNAILKNTETITRETADVAPQFKGMIDNLNKTSEKLQTAVDSLDGLLTNWNGVAGEAQKTMLLTQEALTDARATMATTRKGIAAATEQFETVASETELTLTAARGAIGSTESLINNDITMLVRDTRKTVNDISKLVTLLDGVLAKNEEAIDVFASEGLINFTRFVEEARDLILTANRMIETLEADPSRIIFGDQRGGRQAD